MAECPLGNRELSNQVQDVREKWKEMKCKDAKRKKEKKKRKKQNHKSTGLGCKLGKAYRQNVKNFDIQLRLGLRWRRAAAASVCSVGFVSGFSCCKGQIEKMTVKKGIMLPAFEATSSFAAAGVPAARLTGGSILCVVWLCSRPCSLRSSRCLDVWMERESQKREEDQG